VAGEKTLSGPPEVTVQSTGSGARDQVDRMTVVRLWVTLFSLGVATVFIALFGTGVPGARFVGDTAAYGPHVLTCLFLALLLCAGQIVIIWAWKGLGRRWWQPIGAELLLPYGVAVTSSQVFGGVGHECYDGRCTVIYSTYFPWWWIGLCCGVGLVIGCIWSFETRSDRTSRGAGAVCTP